MSASTPAQQQTVNVADLDLAQLRDVRRQLEEELAHLTGSFQQLKAAQAKFRSCLTNVEEVSPANADRTILVPLSNSLYVPGKLADLEHVIIDVGTGYYVKKACLPPPFSFHLADILLSLSLVLLFLSDIKQSRADASKHYNEKIDFVKGNLETLQETLTRKQDNLQYIVNITHVKEQGAGAGTSAGSS